MRPTPRILLKAADYGEGVVDTSPAPLSASSPPTSTCVSHACRWWPYSSGSKELKANTAMVIIILLSVLTLAVGLKSAIRCFLRATHILVVDEERPHNVNNNRRLRDNINPHDELVVVETKTHGNKSNVGPTMVYSAEMKAEMAGGAAECAICLAEFVDGEVIRVLERCKHGFHFHCIQAWLSTSRSSCPTCRCTCLPPPPPTQSAEVGQPPLPESAAP